MASKYDELFDLLLLKKEVNLELDPEKFSEENVKVAFSRFRSSYKDTPFIYNELRGTILVFNYWGDTNKVTIKLEKSLDTSDLPFRIIKD